MPSSVRMLGGAICSLVLIAGMGQTASGDIPHIKNSKPAFPAHTILLKELWRVGGEGGDLLFGTVTEATTDPDGNVYLLDTQLHHVEVISPEGEHLRTLSREGEGPGEVLRPRDVVFLPDSTIGLLELFPAKLVQLSLDGEPRGTLVVGGSAEPQTGFSSASHCVFRGGTLVLAGQRLVSTETEQKRDMFLCRLSETGEEMLRFRESTMTLDFRKLHMVERDMQPSFHLTSAVGPDGRVYVPQSWERYAIEVFHPDGTLERVIEREFENRKRTDDELRRIHALFDASDRNIGQPVTREIEASPPAIAALHVDAKGRIWVQHSRSNENRTEGVMLKYDLFESSGRYLQNISIACEGDPDFDGLEFLPDGRILLIKGHVLAGMARSDLGNIALGEEEESAPMEVICYQVPS